jgi:four helix bundle protein
VVSIPANIAEGFRKKTGNDKARFLNIAQGSLEETRYYLILANDLGYGNCENLESVLDEIGRMLDAYLKRFRSIRIDFLCFSPDSCLLTPVSFFQRSL